MADRVARLGYEELGLEPWALKPHLRPGLCILLLPIILVQTLFLAVPLDPFPDLHSGLSRRGL